MVFINYIVHKTLVIVFIYSVFVFFLPHLIYATDVLNIKIDPASPVYNQEFKCAITLSQDDHRNACDLIPLNAPADMKPWDICRIDHLSEDKKTRYYKCIANTSRGVPGPGNYQIVIWNFVGDGESGQITARQNITILAAPLPSNTPKPSPTSYFPPTTKPSPSPYPTQYQKPTEKPTAIIMRPTQSLEYSITPTIIPSPHINLSTGLFNSIEASLSSYLQGSLLQTKTSIFAPLWEVIARFLEETYF